MMSASPLLWPFFRFPGARELCDRTARITLKRKLDLDQPHNRFSSSNLYASWSFLFYRQIPLCETYWFGFLIGCHHIVFPRWILFAMFQWHICKWIWFLPSTHLVSGLPKRRLSGHLVSIMIIQIIIDRILSVCGMKNSTILPEKKQDKVEISVLKPPAEQLRRENQRNSS